MKRQIIILFISLILLTGCTSSKNMSDSEVLKLIKASEENYVTVGMLIDNNKENIYNFLSTGNSELIKDFCSEDVCNELKELQKKLGNFVILKQEYMTGIGHSNITHYMLLRTFDGFTTLYFYWDKDGLYAIEKGDVLYV